MTEATIYESHIDTALVWKVPPSPNMSGQTWREAYFSALEEMNRYRAAIIAHLDSGNCLESDDLISALGSGRLPIGGE